MLYENRQVKIFYFTGTGNTRKVADCFEDTLKIKGIYVQKYSIVDKNASLPVEDDLILLVFPVHAFNAPEAVYNWINRMPAVNNSKAVVISVSAGGEVTPNNACRISCIKRLEKKGYDVVYESMLVMPSNFVVATKEELAVRLLEVLPLKVEFIVEKILTDERRRSKPTWLSRLISRVGEVEKIGAKDFGKRIICGESCNGCRWCSLNCPQNNINIENGRPTFGNSCCICLSCIYGCPRKALSPGMMKFFLIKQGFSLKYIEEKVPYSEPVDIVKLTRGITWAGLRKYLLKND